MSDIYVTVTPPQVVDVIVNPSNNITVATNKYDISSAVTKNEVISLINNSPLNNFTISGEDAVTVSNSGNNFIISAPLSTGAIQTGSLTGVFFPLKNILYFKTELNSGINYQQILYGQTLSSIPTSVNCTIQNEIDNLIYSFVISSVNISGFTINFSDYLSNTGYKLNSTVII